jgi:hypothetical protein
MGGLRKLGRAALVAAVVSATAVVVAAAPAHAAACSAESQAVWGVSCNQTADDNVVIREEVTYTSAGTSIAGIVCRPDDAGVHPILVVNHGGFAALSAIEESACDEWARTYDYVVIASAYRTVNTGTPNDDACLGEVDDTLAMLDLAQDLDYVDPDRVVMRGGSHGGCVTLRAYQQGVPGLVAAAAIFPVSDATDQWNFLNDSYNNGANLCPVMVLLPLLSNCANWRNLRIQLETSTGGAPGPTTQAAYDARSAVLDADVLATSAVPLVITHGVTDAIIPLQQSCTLVATADATPSAPDFEEFHFLATAGNPITSTAPAGCTGLGPWPSTGDPTANGYPNDKYFFVYAGTGHTTGGQYPAMLADVDNFLRTKNP